MKRNEPTTVHHVMERDPIGVSCKPNKGEANTAEQDNGSTVKAAEYQAVTAAGGKCGKRNSPTCLVKRIRGVARTKTHQPQAVVVVFVVAPQSGTYSQIRGKLDRAGQ